MKAIIEILKNYKFDKKDFFYFLFFLGVSEILYLFFPQFIRKIVSVIELGLPVKNLFFWSGVLALSSILILVIYFISNYFSHKLWLVLYTKKVQYYREKLFKVNYKEIIDTGTGRLITRLKDGAEGEIEIFHHLLHLLISGIFRGILVVIILFIYVPELIFGALFGILLLIILNYFFHNLSQKYNKKEQKLWEENGRIGARIIMENLIIRVFGKQNYELEKSKKILKDIPKYGVIVDMLNGVFYTIIELLLRLLEVGVYVIIGVMILKGEKSIAYLIMVTGYIWLLWWPLKNAVSNLNRINRMWEKYKKLQRFLDKPIEIVDGVKKYNYKKGKIEFENVSFSYDKSKQIFNDFNLKILPGKKNALIGHSGGGKTTIVKIILRLFDYKRGKISVDGQDLKELKIETLYKHIGYLPQDPAIFDGTIRENLEYAIGDNEKYSDEILWDVLKKAKIDDMVLGLENGLETEIGEKGIKLSGGEKQRLAIARVFLKNPDIIILDEPTSALDSISESKITKTLDKLMKGKTSIIIAHRLQTVLKSDKIIVIDEGKIETEGNHKELLKKSRIYKELVSLQSSIIE